MQNKAATNCNKLSCLQADIQIVGDPNNILPLQWVVGEALDWLMMQEGYHQALLLLHLHCSRESALACSNMEAAVHMIAAF